MPIMSIVIPPYNAEKTILKTVQLERKQIFMILRLLLLMMAQAIDNFHKNVKILTISSVIFTYNIEYKII